MMTKNALVGRGRAHQDLAKRVDYDYKQEAGDVRIGADGVIEIEITGDRESLKKQRQKNGKGVFIDFQQRNRAWRGKKPAPNPFKIITTHLPEWWSSSETEDLRDGLYITRTLGGIPFRAISRINVIEDVVDILKNTSKGGYSEAIITAMSLVAGDGAGRYMRNFQSNEVIERAVSTGVSQSTSWQLSADCYTCER